MADSTKEQILRLIFDTSTASRAGAQYHATAEARIKKTGAAQAKANKDVEKSFKDLVAEGVKQNKILDAALAKSRKERTAAEKKESSDRIKSEKSEASEKAKAAKETSDRIKRLTADETRFRKTEAAKQVADAKAALRSEMSEMAQQHRYKMLQWDLEQKALRAQKDAAVDVTGAITGYVAAFATVGTAVMGVKAIAEYFAEIKRDSIDAVKEMLQFRETVLELAAIKGQLGNSTPQTAAQLRMISQTAQTPQDSVAMMTAAAGAGQAAVGVNITQEAFDKGYLAAAKLQAIEGPGAGSAYGDLYGTLAMEAKAGTTGDQMAGQMYKEFKIAQPGKFKSMGDFAKQRQAISAYVQTGSLTGDQASGILSAITASAPPEEAATITRQILSSLTTDSMRARKMKLLPGAENETSAEYFQKHLGIDLKHTSSFDMLDKVTDDILKAEIDAKTKGEDFNAERYLGNHGMNNAEARRGYAIMAASKKQGTWQKTFLPAINGALEPGGIDAKFDERVGREPILQNRLADNSALNTAAIRASGTEGTLLAGQKVAFQQLKDDGKVIGTFEDFAKRRANPLYRTMDNIFYGGDVGYDTRFQLQHQHNVLAQAREKGIDTEGMVPHTRHGAEQYMGDEALAGLTQQVQAAGGNPLAAVVEQGKRAADTMERVEKLLTPKGAANPNAVAPQPPPLNMPPVKPGAGPRMGGH